MVSQNTVSRDKLTQKDKKAIDICRNVSEVLEELIPWNKREEFRKEYGQTHHSRDGGQGRAAGKLQRDALCTRGRQAKAPFSNRNLRWHPLVLANACPTGFTEMGISVNTKKKLLVFKSKKDGREYSPDEVYTLPNPHCVAKDAWFPHLGELKKWTTEDWIPNWCAIPLIEYSPWNLAIESYAVLGITISAGIFGSNLSNVYNNVRKIIENEFQLSDFFPPLDDRIIQCPLCKGQIKEYPAGLKQRERPDVWKPAWEKIKRGEGDDQSIQLVHMNPLVESEISHNASNVRYGHRWCNCAMTDHSLSQTIAWMKEVIKKQP